MSNFRFEEGVVTSVAESEECWDISYDLSGEARATDGTDLPSYGFTIPKTYQRFPKVGDKLKLKILGASYIAGLWLNNVEVYDKSEEQIEAERKAEATKLAERRYKEFEEQKDQLDADYEALPDVFKRRIDKFRNTNPNFRWEFEPYEIFCCKEAVMLASALKTREAVKDFYDLSHEERRKAVPDLSRGHSGNSFGCAVSLAHAYVSDPELVVKMHGALVTLVGCDAYGCPHEPEPEVESPCPKL